MSERAVTSAQSVTTNWAAGGPFRAPAPSEGPVGLRGRFVAGALPLRRAILTCRHGNLPSMDN